jgi:NADH-quinone oxidoreductase subunit N
MAVNSTIGAYYYFRLIVIMYMREPNAEISAAPLVAFPFSIVVVLVITAIATVALGVAPNPILRFILDPALIGNLR